MLSPQLYCLYTLDCTSTHSSNHIIKFADDTTVIGLISGNDESAYRDEVRKLMLWCSENNLVLNTRKTKELIVDFRKCKADPLPIIINGDYVERVRSFKFLGIYLSNSLSWSTNTTAAVKKAQQRLHFLRVLKKKRLCQKLLVAFYRSAIESVLTYCLTVWYGGCSGTDKKALQRVIKNVQNITGCPLPLLQDIANTRYLSRAKKHY